MKPETDALWHDLPADWRDQLAAWVRQADERRSAATAVYFRADDVAVPGRQIRRLVEIFRRQACPLGLAVVPAWLTPPRWQSLRGLTRGGRNLWCWHQHGWRHRNHEPGGKKQEFGPSRSTDAIAADLARGRRRLATIMGADFYPLFTPPWNRCSEITLALLREMGYKAVSRSRDSRPGAPPGLPDHAMDLDLHTGRAPSATLGWLQLAKGLKTGLSRPACGIMIHHQRMDAAAFDFLEALLEILRRQPRLTLVDFRDLSV